LPNKKGGSFLFRPIGLNMLAEAYSYASNNAKSIKSMWKKIDQSDFDLNGEYWKDIAWDTARMTMIPRRNKLLKEYLFYLLGFEYDKEYLLIEYNKAFGVSEKDRNKVKLPNKI
jgi:hypothetical protein